MFYAVTFCVLPWLKRWPLPIVLAELAACVILIAYPAPEPFTRPARLFVLLAPLFFGQAVYLGWSDRISKTWMVAVLLAWWLVGEIGLQAYGSSTYLAANAVSVWRGLAYLSFGLILALEVELHVPRFVSFIAACSYSIYLLHLPLGYLPMWHVTKLIGYPLALAIALAATFLGSWLSYRYVEIPFQGVGRALIKRMQATFAQKPAQSWPLPSA
jgi:peptidoglycan/LPS O-acetylase OafA/YrhL